MRKILNLPNLLSGLRILLTPVFILLFFGDLWMQILSIVVFTLAALTDAYDGYLARKNKLTTSFGAFIDPIADKVQILSTFAVFAYINFIGWWVVAVFALRDLLITWLRSILIRRGTSLVTSKIAKLKTVLQFIAVYLLFANLLLHNAGFQIIWVDYFVSCFVYLVVAFTLYTALDYIKPFIKGCGGPTWFTLSKGARGELVEPYERKQVSGLPAMDHCHSKLSSKCICHPEFISGSLNKITTLIASFFYIGYVHFGPGTAASFVTALITFFLPTNLILFNLIIILFLSILGVICSGHIEKTLSIKDPKWIVIDEVLGMYLCLFWLPKDIWAYFILFLLFRFFDITKIYPINKAEEIDAPGWGVMLDDVVAAAYAIMVALILSVGWFLFGLPLI